MLARIIAYLILSPLLSDTKSDTDFDYRTHFYDKIKLIKDKSSAEDANRIANLMYQSYLDISTKKDLHNYVDQYIHAQNSSDPEFSLRASQTQQVQMRIAAHYFKGVLQVFDVDVRAGLSGDYDSQVYNYTEYPKVMRYFLKSIENYSNGLRNKSLAKIIDATIRYMLNNGYYPADILGIHMELSDYAKLEALPPSQESNDRMKNVQNNIIGISQKFIPTIAESETKPETEPVMPLIVSKPMATPFKLSNMFKLRKICNELEDAELVKDVRRIIQYAWRVDTVLLKYPDAKKDWLVHEYIAQLLKFLTAYNKAEDSQLTGDSSLSMMENTRQYAKELVEAMQTIIETLYESNLETLDVNIDVLRKDMRLRGLIGDVK